MLPIDKLNSQKELIDLAINHGYLPQSSMAGVGVIAQALAELGYGNMLKPGCSGCVMDLMKVANRILKQ